MKLNKLLGWFNIKTFLIFSGSNVLFQLVTLVAELAILRMVSVNLIGIWQYVLLIQGYVVFTRLGIINSFNREYPFLISSQNTNKADSVLKTTAFHIRMSMAVQALIFAVLLIFQLLKGGNPDLVWALAAMILYTVFDAQSNFEEAKLRNVLFFKQISIIKLIQSLMILATLILPYYYGFHGLLWRVIGLQIFVLLSYKISTKNSKANWDKAIWLELFYDGWKFWIFSYLKGFIKSMPRLYISIFSTLTVLGLFTPINWILLSFTLFTSSLTTYLYPLLSQRHAKGDQRLQIQSLTINGIAFAIAIPFALIGIYLIPSLMHYFLPEYNSSVKAMQITIIASLFDIITVTTTIWYSMKSWKNLILFYALTFFVNIICFAFVYLMKNGNTLINISYAILMSSIISSLIILVLVFKNEYYDKKKTSILYISG